MEPQMKSKPLAYLLWCLGLFAICGMHRIYIGKYVSGVIWFCTLGLLFVGQIIDFFTLAGQVDVANALTVGKGMKRPQGRGRNIFRDGPPRIPRKKKCPECAESIQLDAKSCRYCGADLTVSSDNDSGITICDCPECGHILEVPSHLVGVPGRCTHCDEVITPFNPATPGERV